MGELGPANSKLTISDRTWLVAPALGWVSYYRVFVELRLLDHLYWRHQIAIARNQVAEVIVIQIRVADDLTGDVDVSLLLLKRCLLRWWELVVLRVRAVKYLTATSSACGCNSLAENACKSSHIYRLPKAARIP